MERTKVKIVEEVLKLAQLGEGYTKKKPFRFLMREISERTGEYAPSVSREIRALKKERFLPIVCMNKARGMYRFTLQGKYSKEAVVSSLQQSLSILRQRTADSSARLDVHRILHERRNRRIPEVSSESQESN